MPLLRAYSPDDEQPLAEYAALTIAFNAAAAAFAIAQKRSGRPLPDRIPLGDVALMTIGTHKLSRLIAKDRVTSFARAPFTRYQGRSGAGEVSEKARGSGLRRLVGELIICPYCLGQWLSAGFLATYLRDPRLARAIAALFTVAAGADFLEQGWVAAEKNA